MTRIDYNWKHSVRHTDYEARLDTLRGHNRAVTSLIAAGGIIAASYPGNGVQVYEPDKSATFRIPDVDVRALALILDEERAKDEMEDEGLANGVSKGWGSNPLLLVTGGRRLKVWNVPCRSALRARRRTLY